MPTSVEWETYQKQFTPDQLEIVEQIRWLVKSTSPDLSEDFDNQPWLSGYLIFTRENGESIYMLGLLESGHVGFHILPYYASKGLREKYSEPLSDYLCGRCVLAIESLSDELQTLLTNIMTDIADGHAKNLANGNEVKQ